MATLEEAKAIIKRKQESGEITPAPAPGSPASEPTARADRGMVMRSMAASDRAGTLQVSDDEMKILEEAPDEGEIEIRADGLVYLPWPWYQNKLRKAFKMEWSLLPDGNPILKENLLLWPHGLFVRGAPVAYAIGECSYRPDNRTMSYGDAMEGARSNALMRVCKSLGMAAILWNRDYTEYWRNKYAKMVIKDQKRIWVKKTKEELDEEKG